MADTPAKPPNTRIAVCTILSAATKQGMVEFSINDTKAQMDLDKAREVHRMLGSAIEAAMSDQMLVVFLVEKVGLPLQAAVMALRDFREMRQGSTETVFPQ